MRYKATGSSAKQGRGFSYKQQGRVTSAIVSHYYQHGQRVSAGSRILKSALAVSSGLGTGPVLSSTKGEIAVADSELHETLRGSLFANFGQ